MTTRTIASGYAIANGTAFILGGLLGLATDRLDGGWFALAAIAIYAALGASFHVAVRRHYRDRPIREIAAIRARKDAS